MPTLQTEIQQSQPPSSLQEEAVLNVLRTADFLNRAFQRHVRPWGITATQYNVLRILRGAHPHGLTCSELGQRMVTSDPDITRLLGRLKALKRISQSRDPDDHRILHNHIQKSGLALLAEMDSTIQALPISLLCHMPVDQLRQMIQALEEARKAGCGESASCDGSQNLTPDKKLLSTADKKPLSKRTRQNLSA